MFLEFKFVCWHLNVKGEFWEMFNENLKLLRYVNYNLKDSEHQENSIFQFFEKTREIENAVQWVSILFPASQTEKSNDNEFDKSYCKYFSDS